MGFKLKASFPATFKPLDQTMKKRKAMFVAHLAEWSLPLPEVRGSNSVMGKILYRTCFRVNI